MSTPVAGVITRYFEAADRRHNDAIVALFTDNAIVVDEGETWRGAKEIRAWREGGPSTYQYTTEVLGTERTGENTYVVAIRLEGNFPGGTAELKSRFTIDGDLISRLEIAP
jgi:hypothetical protein